MLVMCLVLKLWCFSFLLLMLCGWFSELLFIIVNGGMLLLVNVFIFRNVCVLIW